MDSFSENRIVAVIPVKEKSDRVPNKNFRAFTEEGLSLLDLTLRKLSALNNLDHIYISTDKEDIDTLPYKNITILKRDKIFCNNVTPWSEVIFNVVNSIPEKDNTTILWAHTTTPLFNFYKEALAKYMDLDQDINNSLVAVEKFKEFLIDNKGRPINYMYGVWHKYSQDLPELFKITGALFINQLHDMKTNRYVIGTNPYLFEVAPELCLDIDNQWQFDLAQIIYKNF